MKTLPAVYLLALLAVFPLLDRSDEAQKPISAPMKRVVDPNAHSKNLAATSTFTMFPYDQSAAIINLLQPSPGCGCALPTNSDPGPNGGYADKMKVSPDQNVQVLVGQPIELRYDASVICHRQTIWDMTGKVHKNVDQIGDLTLGTVQWEVGSVWALPLEWGIATYSGYSQTGTQQVIFTIRLQCHDDFKNCTHTCLTTRTITVNVLP